MTTAAGAHTATPFPRGLTRPHFKIQFGHTLAWRWPIFVVTNIDPVSGLRRGRRSGTERSRIPAANGRLGTRTTTTAGPHRRRLNIEEAVTEVNRSELVWGTPKSHETRSVLLPRSLATELGTCLDSKGPNHLLFT